MPSLKSPEILPIMVGTAGHVDHGKTSLVQLLTGCNTDVLKEEQKRGLTIDLGFAPCLLRGNRMVGIVDVPGHIDFIKNMVAGVAMLDILLLIVAADDSVMPQTIEHLQIVKLLRTPLIMTVITKIDLVEPDIVELVKTDVKDFLIRSGYPDAPILPMSNITMQGINAVRETLGNLVDRAVEKHAHDPEQNQAFRMNIERVFSINGFGTVVTGIPRSSSLDCGENVELLPAHVEGKIRSVQNYKHTSNCILPNVCNAVNISGIDADQITRGMTLVTPGVYQPVTRVTAHIQNVGRIPITDGLCVRFHTGTASVNADILLLNPSPILPGSEGYIQLRLSDPVVLLASDHYIIRRYTPSETLGGGEILSIQNNKFRRTEEGLCERLTQAYHAILQHKVALSEIICSENPIFRGRDILRYAGFTQAHHHVIEALVSDTQQIYAIGDDYYLYLPRIHETIERVSRFLTRFHSQKIYSWGIEPALIAPTFNLPPELGKTFVNFLCNQAPHTLKIRHARLSLAIFTPQITNKQMRQKDDLLRYLTECAEKIPAQGNILESMQLTQQEYKSLIKIMIESNDVYQLGNHLFEYNLYQKIYQKVLNYFQETNEGMSIQNMRDISGLSRNMAVVFLEHLDGKGITRRQGDMRIFTGARHQ